MEKQEVLKKIGNWLKLNRLAILYPILAIFIEMTAVFAVEGTPFMSRPFLSLGLLAVLTGILLILPDNRSRLVVGASMLVVHWVLDIIFAVIFEMTSGQYFNLEMLNLRNDAVATLESIPINFFVFYGGALFCIAYLIYGLRSIREDSGYKIKRRKYSIWFYVGLMAAGITTTVSTFFVYYPAERSRYEEMVYGNAESVYSSYGMIGNLIGEFGNALKKDKTDLTEAQAERFFYQQESTPTEYFGISKDKNVVMLLSESFEWYAFLRSDEYPNALAFTDEELAELYPNLTQFYNESVIATNYHSREKTDISETLSLLGSYPTGAFINYDYYDNTIPNTVPNVLKMLDPQIELGYYHNGYKTFYNRIETHDAYGFNSVTDMYDMEEMAALEAERIKEETGEDVEPTFTNYEDQEERNLDSEMIATCKDLMFPTDKRFYTFITTITMHGVYYERNNLQTELEQVKEVLGDRVPDPEEDEKAAALYNYMVTAKEYDDALGLMRRDLEDKGLWDNTVIVLFGDHNAYYQELSNYVKGIDNYHTQGVKYTDLYKVPLMIHDSDLEKEVGHLEIDKFACTSDLVPTLLDLLGIKYYSNLYYGNSLFHEEKTVLYSRAYGIFVSDGIVGNTVKNIQYCYYTTESGKAVLPDQLISLEEYNTMISTFDRNAQKLIEKTRHCDYIFETNYFGDEGNLMEYTGRMLNLNGKI